jgi:NADPH-dependent curcumin reductase CurA
MNRQLQLTAYPTDVPALEHFSLVERAIPTAAEGEALVRTLWLGLDPFPRMQMTGQPGGPPQLPLGSVMIGRGVAQVIESRRPDLTPGQIIVCEPGWQDYALVPASAPTPQRLDPATAPIQTALGVLGPSGLTAWCTLFGVAALQPGETVIVTAAAGSVGSTACQLARAHGARVVAIGGGADQLAFLRETLGVDAALDYQATDDLAGALVAACPGGAQVALDTVGGATHEAIVRAMAPRGRLVMAGFISGYAGARPRYTDPHAVIMKRLTLSGFLLADHAAQFEAARAALAEGLAVGALRAFETITDGLENAPTAFGALFGAARPGKHLVRVAQPTGVAP